MASIVLEMLRINVSPGICKGSADYLGMYRRIMSLAMPALYFMQW
jgi:hypothetical protein